MADEPLAASLTVPAALDLPGTLEETPFEGLDFDLDLSTSASPLSASTPPAVEDTPGAIAFDLSALSLDLDEPLAAAEVPADPLPEADVPAEEADPIDPADTMDRGDENDPLATKLSLAEEFNSIGDEDGARALAEEVLEEATGTLRAKAQKFLDSLA